jgi:hypothetical protein
MDNGTLSNVLATLATELATGGPRNGSYVLNGGDAGLLGSVDRLSARHASESSHGGATIAAHVDHLAYGLSLINRWKAGEPNPWEDADWSRSWTRTRVTDDEWTTLRGELRDQVERWAGATGVDREMSEVELAGLIGSVAHVAYHLGAIRQIEAVARGPKDGE